MFAGLIQALSTPAANRMATEMDLRAPSPLPVRLGVAVTGHRAANPVYAANAGAIAATLADIFDLIDQQVADTVALQGNWPLAATRLHTLFTDGTDQVAAGLALTRGWELASPLPFGRALNTAVNALPTTLEDARALLAGGDPADETTRHRAAAINSFADQAHVLELADQDDAISTLYLSMMEQPDDLTRAQSFTIAASKRAGLAGKILIEQSDLLVAVWDGVSTSTIGGAGQTVAAALNLGAGVVWINPAQPARWRILHAPESLTRPGTADDDPRRAVELADIIRNALCPDGEAMGRNSPAIRGIDGLTKAVWRDSSSRLTHGYRRIETMFGGEGRPFRPIVQHFVRPDDPGAGTWGPLLSAANGLPGAEPGFSERIRAIAYTNFAWADAISARLSDKYRGGMVVNFLLSGLAIVGGIAYLPFASPDQKWMFATAEFLLLLTIVAITMRGRAKRWHGQWFETRRVAEYFRHSPLLLILGVARSPGRWPRGTDTSWPEWYVRHALRSLGLPRIRMTNAYLRGALDLLQVGHVAPQRDYHAQKAKRLRSVHHKLDTCSNSLFVMAIASVALYLALVVLAPGLAEKGAKLFTLLGVLFPTFGATIAGIRYFGDFERFAAISEVASERLGIIAQRIATLQNADDRHLTYDRVAELAHATDDAVIQEIENWQSVFAGKHVTVPV